MPTWNPQANDLFLKALELRSAGERQEYLDGACTGDAALRAEVESLLEANARAGSFLESPALAPHLVAALTESSGGGCPALEPPALAPQQVATVDDPITERPGTVI